VALDAGPSVDSTTAASCAPVDVASAAVDSNDDRATSSILEVNVSTVAGSSSDTTALLDSEVAEPITEVNISTVAGSSVGSSASVVLNFAAPIPELNMSTFAGFSVGSSAPSLGLDVASPIPEMNMSTVAGSFVGSSAPSLDLVVAAPILEVNMSTVAGSSIGSSAIVLGPPIRLDSGNDLVEVGLVMRDLFGVVVLAVPTLAGTSLSCTMVLLLDCFFDILYEMLNQYMNTDRMSKY
jgi:hypothetical protein